MSIEKNSYGQILRSSSIIGGVGGRRLIGLARVKGLKGRDLPMSEL
jgi:hypothetical protein